MKKQISVCLAVMLALLLPSLAGAETSRARIIDGADIFTYTWESRLTEMTTRIRQQYNFDIVIYTTDD